MDLIGRIDRAPGDLGHGRAKGLKIIDLGLIDQNVAIGQKQDALLGARLPQTPDDLKCGVGLAGAGCHHQQYPILAFRYGFYGLVDGLQLVVAGRFATAIRVVVLADNGQLGLGVALPSAEFVPKLARAGEILQRDLGFQLGRIGLVMKYEAIAVAGKYEGHIQQAGIIEPLLHPLANVMLVGFGLDHRQWQAHLVIEHDIGRFDLFACRHLAAHHHLAIPQLHLLADLCQVIPPRRLDSRQQVFGDDVSFGEGCFVDLGHEHSSGRGTILLKILS
ncbi:hypothetical protein D3C79_447070 [compost metagenome]